jgi:aspartate/methionine/tyrosine aminotransferase
MKENLVLMADEVYQTNIYGDRPFVSFRKVGYCVNKLRKVYIGM